jgi:hypothetical protein
MRAVPGCGVNDELTVIAELANQTGDLSLSSEVVDRAHRDAGHSA